MTCHPRSSCAAAPQTNLTRPPMGLPTEYHHNQRMPYETFYPALDRCYRLARYVLGGILYEVAVWPGQDRVLCALQPDGVNIQSELGRRLCMNEKALHRSLEYLRDKVYYVHFRESPTDMRVNRITMTKHGIWAADTIRHAYGIVAQQMCVGFTATELEGMNRMLELATRREAELRGRKLDLREVLDRGRF